MNYKTITVSSLTYAMKLKKLLSKGGIISKLIKVEDKEGMIGCLHGVRISNADLLRAIVIMRQNDVEYSIYE